MGLLNSLFNLYTRKQIDMAIQTGVQKAVDGSRLRGIRPISNTMLGSQDTTPAKRTDYLKTYESYVWVYAAVYANASNLARIPLRLYKIGADGEKGDEIKSGREWDLINHPNPLQSKYDFFESLISSLELTGDAFIEKDSPTNPTQLYVLRPDWVKIKGSRESLVDHYEYDVNGTKIRFEPDEIIHIKYYNPRSELFGLAPIGPATNSVVLDLYSIAYQKNFFKQGAAVDVAFMSPNSLSNDNYKRLKDEIRTEYSGVDRSHLPILLDNDIKIQEVGVSPEKTLLKEQRIMNRDEVLAAYGVPPIMVGLLDDATFNNTEQQKKAYWENTIIPKSVKVEDKYNDKLFPDNNIIAEFDFSDVPALQEDAKKQMEVNTGYVKGGILTPNEARERIGLQAVDGGDELKEPKAEGGAPVAKIYKADRADFKKKQKIRFQQDYKAAEDAIFEAMVKDFKKMASNTLKTVNINKSDVIVQKDLLEDASRGIEAVQPDITKQLTVTYNKTLGVVIGKNYFDVVRRQLPTIELDAILQASKESVAQWAEQASASIVNTMKGRTTNYLQTALKDNHDIAKVTKNIQRIFTGDTSLRPRDRFPWARTIARTEAGKAVNTAKNEGYKKAGVKKKEWIWSGLDRDWHGGYEGEGVVDMDYTYQSEHGSIQFPHDVGASASDVINCACTFTFAE